MRRALWSGLLLLAFLLPDAGAQALQPIPKLETRVTDVTGTLTASQQSELDGKLAAFEQRKGAQVAVLIVPTTEPEAVEQYSLRVVEQWKIGRSKPDDGVLLLVARNDRTMRIEVGYGLEGVLTDAVARRIIADTIAPLFRQGDYYAGVNAGAEQIMRVVDGEQLPPPDRRWSGGAPSTPQFLPFVIFAVFGGAMVLRQLLGRGVGSVATGGIAGLLTFAFTKVLPIAVLAGLAGFLFALLTGFGGGRRGGGGGGGWPGALGGLGGMRSSGRSWGGGGGFGGGGGGFSGGGGGFGGGGASGRW